jgi:Tfp pilus assembly protein PilN
MIRINLLKPEKKELKEAPLAAPPVEFKAKRGTSLWGLILLVALAAIAVLFFYLRGEMTKEQDLLAKAREEKQSLQYVVAKLDELERQRDLLQRKIRLIQDLKAIQPSAVIIMDEVSKHLPEWVWLTETVFSGTNVRIKGRSVSNNLLADYIHSLEESPFFQDVNLSSSILRRTRNDSYHEFSLSFRFLPPQSEAETTSTTAEGGQK